MRMPDMAEVNGNQSKVIFIIAKSYVNNKKNEFVLYFVLMYIMRAIAF